MVLQALALSEHQQIFYNLEQIFSDIIGYIFFLTFNAVGEPNVSCQVLRRRDAKWTTTKTIFLQPPEYAGRCTRFFCEMVSSPNWTVRYRNAFMCLSPGMTTVPRLASASIYYEEITVRKRLRFTRIVLR